MKMQVGTEFLRKSSCDSKTNRIQDVPVPIKRMLVALLCVTRSAIEAMRFEEDKPIVGASPHKGQRCRCPLCDRKSPSYDCSAYLRRWRTLNFGFTMTCLEYRTLRVRCPEHGIVAVSVP